MDLKKIIKNTSDLIKIPSTKENVEARKKAVNLASDFLKNKGIFIKKFSPENNPCLVATLKKGQTNPCIFMVGHLDVVPGEKSQFHPKIKQNRIYGRGAGDMKAAVAVMIEVLKYFSSKKNKPSLGLILTTDEEQGGFNGAGYLINKKHYQPKHAVVPDGGKALNTIVTDEKGVLHLQINSQGKRAHGARPFLGENAIDKLISDYLKIKKIILELKTPSKWQDTLNIGKISGGTATNQVPDRAEMNLDIRFIKKNEHQKIIKKIKNNIKSKVKITALAHPFHQNKNNAFIKQYLSIAKQQTGKEVEFVKSESASDARFFSEKNIPTLVTKIKCDNIHAKNEWVSIKEMEHLYQILLKLIERTCF